MGLILIFFPVKCGVPQGLVISPTLFLLCLNDFLCLTTNPIYSFAADGSLCYRYSYSAHPNFDEVGTTRNCMNDTLNSDKNWRVGRADRVEFNARKIQCYLLSQKRICDPGQNVCTGGMEIARSETFDVLGTSIRSDVRPRYSLGIPGYPNVSMLSLFHNALQGKFLLYTYCRNVERLTTKHFSWKF